MNNIVVACKTLEDEVKLALQETRKDYGLAWLDAGLHDYPDTLRERIQEKINEIDELESIDYILLAFGLCGNALEGIYSRSASIVMPRIDDCIPLLLGQWNGKEKVNIDGYSYYMTRGWLNNEMSVANDYERFRQQHGEDKAKEIFRMIYNNYKRLLLVDTGAYEIDEITDKIKTLASLIDLKFELIPGSLHLFKQLMAGPWDENFCIFSPGEVIKKESFIDI